jgi:Zn-dependent M28 family amino/carboxypeptidase
MTAAQRERTAGMISIDMIAYGPDFHVRSMQRGPQSLVDALLEFATVRDAGVTFLKDPGSSGWSDHEAYELAGIPVAWVQWRDDPYYHSPQDTVSHISRDKVARAGQLVLDYVRSLDEEDLAALRQ